MKTIAEFSTEHVDYQLLHKDTDSWNDKTYESWNNVMTQSYNKLKHAEKNKHDSELTLRLLTEEFLNDPEKMRELDELEFHSKKGGKKTVHKKKKTTVKKKSKMRKKTAKKYRK